MADFHRLRVEGVHSAFSAEKLLWARDQTWKVFHEIKASLKEGITEKEAFDLSLKIFADHGVQKHWHKPYVRFGGGTALTFNHPLQETYQLKENDPVYIDLGPAWFDPASDAHYEGDVGDTFVFGKNVEASKCAEAARRIFLEIQDDWKARKLNGLEIYKLMAEKAAAAGYRLTEDVLGHRISDFPHKRYAKEQLGEISFNPSPILWVLEIHITEAEQKFGAFFEDVLGA